MCSIDYDVNQESMNIVIVGHVDHGKSTIVGRLLADTNSLPQGKLDQVKEQCKKNSKPFEYAFLLDALKDERSQGITIDAARCFFKTLKRKYKIIDAPGHIEFLKNMVTGAANAEAALLVIDANEGIKENSKRHGYMISVLGIKQVVVVVNKMDLVGYNHEVFNQIKEEYSEFMKQINVKAEAFIPASGINGDNIAEFTKNMRWYKGKTILEQLDLFHCNNSLENKPFRMPVQGVYKFTKMGDDRRIIAGTILTGKVCVGDEVFFYPSLKKSKIKSIEAFNSDAKLTATAGEAVGFTLEEQIYVKRGEVAVLVNEQKPLISNRIKTSLFWVGKNSMQFDKKYYLKIGNAKVGVQVEKIIRNINTSNLMCESKNKIERNDAAECILRLDKPIAFDSLFDNALTSRFVIVDNYQISGGGIIQDNLCDNKNIFWSEGKITYKDRCQSLKQNGLVIWFTGVSGVGKSTIACELEKALFADGKFAYRLDGDNLRFGLNSDLGFANRDRLENVRRIGETAALFKDAGLIVLVACISPNREMREFAKEKVENNFIEIYVKASLETCIKRDTKGLYKKAKSGELSDFTAISLSYEEPSNPDIILDTDLFTVEECVEKVLEYIESEVLL